MLWLVGEETENYHREVLEYPALAATVYTHLLINSKILNLAPLAPQVWGEQDFKVPQGWGI